MWRRTLLVGFLLAAPAAAQEQPDQGSRRRERERLVDEYIAAAGIQDRATLGALRTVPRHEFVPAGEQARAYEDIPLPIGHGQTISQPAVVATMTELIRPRPGFGCSRLEPARAIRRPSWPKPVPGCGPSRSSRPWPTRHAPGLPASATTGVTVRHGDGYAGWPEEAPFDAIVVTAAADSIPPALIEQLAPNGRLVMPIGAPDAYQALVLVQKDPRGRLSVREMLPVRFVPFLRGIR